MAKYNPQFPSIEQNFDVCWEVISNTWDGKVWNSYRTEVWAESEEQAISLFKAQNPTHTYRSIKRA